MEAHKCDNENGQSSSLQWISFFSDPSFHKSHIFFKFLSRFERPVWIPIFRLIAKAEEGKKSPEKNDSLWGDADHRGWDGDP